MCDVLSVQLLNILFLGIHDNGKGSFFPEGVVGAINTPVGYNLTDSGLTSFPYTALVDGQVRTVCCFFEAPLCCTCVRSRTCSHAHRYVKSVGNTVQP